MLSNKSFSREDIYWASPTLEQMFIEIYIALQAEKNAFWQVLH